MPTPVTDPELLNQLESKPVTDPALLAQLENKTEVYGGSSLVENLKGVPKGVVEGFVSPVNLSARMMDPDVAIALAGRGQDPYEIIKKTSEATDKATSSAINKLGLPEGGPYGRTAGQFIGNPLNLVGGLETLLARLGLAGASGLTSEAAGQATKGTAAEPFARLAGSLVPAGVTAAASRAIRPFPITPERQAGVDALRSRRIEPTAGDVTGSRMVRHLEEMGDVPLGGGTYGANKARVGHEFTAAINSRMGEAADAATPEVIRRAQDRIGDTFDRVALQLPITHDARLGNDLVQIEQDLMREGLPEATINRVHAQIDNVLLGFVTGTTRAGAPRGVMSGETYQGLTRKNTPLARAIDDPDPSISYYATRVRSALDDAMERSATGRGTRQGVGRRQALEDLREARRQWYNMLVISKSVAGPGEAAADGVISPQKLRQNLTNSPDNKLSYAAGRGDLQELARAGNQIMTPLRSSGTAERAVAHGIPAALGSLAGTFLTGEPVSGALLGGAVGPGLTGRIVNSPAVQAVLKNQGRLPSSIPPSNEQAIRSLLLELGRPKETTQ